MIRYVFGGLTQGNESILSLAQKPSDYDPIDDELNFSQGNKFPD